MGLWVVLTEVEGGGDCDFVLRMTWTTLTLMLSVVDSDGV
jgi:hypothetical protein